jgi:hypothetical protein
MVRVEPSDKDCAETCGNGGDDAAKTAMTPQQNSRLEDPDGCNIIFLGNA